MTATICFPFCRLSLSALRRSCLLLALLGVAITSACSGQLSSAINGKGQGPSASSSAGPKRSHATSARNFAEPSYQRGLELMEEKQYSRAVEAFEYAIASAKRTGHAQKPIYYLAVCQAVTLNKSSHYSNDWDDALAACDVAFEKSGDDRAKAWRFELAAEFGSEASDQGHEAHKAEKYDDAKKWFRIALAIDPKPEYLDGLCRSLQPTGSLSAEPRCADRDIP